MPAWKELNMDLRSIVLRDSIYQEQTSASIFIVLLRILKGKTKALGNKSSSLSFKNKIDLLHDLEELTSVEYNHLLKFMEIRNQFIHNHECSSFEKLGKINQELTNHLKKQFPNAIEDSEKSMYKSYQDLNVMCAGKLLVLEREFMAGLGLDFENFVAAQLYRKLDQLYENAKVMINDINAERKYVLPPVFDTPEYHIEKFIEALDIVIAKTRVEILKELEGDQMVRAFKRKVTIKELLEEKRKEKNS